MKTLPKLSEYVKTHREKTKFLSDASFPKGIIDYTNFITQPLNLSHFVPAIEKDGNWIVLELPIKMMNGDSMINEEYQTALDNVVFKGFEIDYDNIVINRNSNNRLQFNDYSIYFNVSSCVVKAIEDIIPYNLEVNETIIKKFNL